MPDVISTAGPPTAGAFDKPRACPGPATGQRSCRGRLWSCRARGNFGHAGANLCLRGPEGTLPAVANAERTHVFIRRSDIPAKSGHCSDLTSRFPVSAAARAALKVSIQGPAPAQRSSPERSTVCQQCSWCAQQIRRFLA